MPLSFWNWITALLRSVVFWLLGAVALLSAILPSVFEVDFVLPLWAFPSIILLGTIWAAYHIHSKTIEMVNPLEIVEYDIFLAAPMDAFGTDGEYENSKKEIEALMKCLRTYCGLKRIFYAGIDIENRKAFDPEDMAFKGNFHILRKTRFFVMVYPRPMPSSVLVEAGYALALGLPILLLVHKDCELPYILRNLPQSTKRVRVYEYQDEHDLLNKFSKHGKEMFNLLENATKDKSVHR